MYFRGIVRHTRYRTTQYRPSKQNKPSRQQVKYEQALSVWNNLVAEKRKLEKEVNKLSKPIQEYKRIGMLRSEAMLKAQQQGKSLDEQFAIQHAVKSRISYEEFLELRKVYDDKRQRIFELTLQEESAKDAANSLKPASKGFWASIFG